MKIFLELLCSMSLGAWSALAAEDAKPATNVVVILDRLHRRLVPRRVTNNPSLKAADSRVRAATLNAGAVRTWEDPMATFGGSVVQRQGIQADERRKPRRTASNRSSRCGPPETGA